MEDSLLARTLAIIAASAIAVGLVTTIRLPAATGYLMAGLALGSLGLVEAGQDMHFLAELGLIFLMFMTGLEFSIPAIFGAWRNVLLAGSMQVGLTTAVVGIGLALAGIGWPAAIVIGGAVAMSSTAITLKLLAEQGEISSRHGHLALGILLFQDLATLPFLILVESWSRHSVATPVGVVAQIAVAAAALIATAVIARPLVRFGLSGVIRTRSPDLFLLCVLVTALGTAYAVHLAGLSPPIGAFLAGMVIGESDFRHRVEEDIRPFRDAFVGLFFVTVGMGIDLSMITAFPAAVLGWVLAFILLKAVLSFATGLAVGADKEVAARTAIILAHGGEFGLLLITLALQLGLLPAELGQPMLVALVATMGIAPLIIQHNHWAARPFGLHERRMAATEMSIRNESEALKDHVILCGCGRVGRLVATALEMGKVPYVAIELDLDRFRSARRQGHNVVFGDAKSRRILHAVGLARSRLVVISFDRPNAVEPILHEARLSNTAPATLVSATEDLDMPRLARLGPTAIYPENLAVGLGLADQALLLFGKTQEEAAQIVQSVRTQLNPELLDMVGI